MNSLWQIFKWNFKRFFRYPEELIEDEHFLKGESYCANVIALTVQRWGKRWLFPVNMALFFLGLILLLGEDVLQFYIPSSSIQIILIVISSFYFILKFDAWKINHFSCFIKLGYIVLSSFAGLLTITYFFLVVFENIEAYSLWRGV